MKKVYTFQELVELIAPILNRYHAESAAVFGSYARGEARPESDIDLIVYGGSSFRPTDDTDIKRSFPWNWPQHVVQRTGNEHHILWR